MADNELYREEIVIEVNDSNVTERVNKLEQRFKRSMDKMNKLAQGLGSKKIEPMIKVRDKLTSSAMKADRLIKKLDAAHASPIIAAQDRVTNVVTRVNALIDAINRRDAKVVAEMKGPLIDELIRAKKAVADLGDVKTGPVAELKGELFYQLSKAQSMMKNVDKMAAKPRVSVRDMATSAIRGIDRGLRFLTSKTWSIGIKVVGGALNTVKNMIGGIGRAITSPLGMLGVGVGVAGAVAGGILKPLDLAGEMEQSRIAFETMLGSAEKAQGFLKDMQKFAATTPFEFPELQENAKLMLAFGFSAERIMPMLRTVGDTAAGLGAGSEGIQRMVRALGQMQAKGRAQTEELLQLQELGVPVNEILQEELGLTSEQIANIGEEGVASGKVIDAILRGMDKRFGGLMDKQSRSLKGLWSTIKDTFNMNVLLRWGEGIRKAVEPRLQKLVDWFGKNESKIEEWGDKLEKIANEASEWVLDKLEKTFKWLDTNFFSNEDFMKLDFKGKVTFVWDKVKDEFDRWYQSAGKDIIAGWGEKIGAGIGAGLMALAGIDISDKFTSDQLKENPFIEAGATAAQAFMKGFGETFDINKIIKKLFEINKNAVSNPSGGNVLGAALTDLIIITIGSKLLSPLFKIGKTVAKPASSAIKWVSGMAKGTTKVAENIDNAAKISKPISVIPKWFNSVLSQGKDYKAAYQLAKETGKGPLRSLFEGTKILKETAAPVAKASRFSFFKDYKAAYQLARETGAGPISSIFEGTKILKETAPVAKASKFSKIFGKLVVPIAIAGSAFNIAASEDKGKAIGKEVGSWAGFAAGAKLGAMAGTAIAPGIGTVIGGAIGGIAGMFGGDWLGGKIVDWIHGDTWDEIKQKGSDAWGAIKQKASDAWSWISTNITFESLARGVGYVYGYLEGTIFNGDWWSKKWESVKTWASNTWSSMVDVWNSVKETISNTVFNGDWWTEKWETVKTWAGNAWGTASEIWESIKTTISDTLFSKEWWDEKWSNVKEWASDTWGAIKNRWNEISNAFSAGREAGRQAANRSITAHALGGILARPHLAMVAEEGPEAVIPLSARRRERALKLWQETGRYLGVDVYADGGYTTPVLTSVQSVKPSGGTVVNIYMDGLISSVEINNADDMQKVANMAADIVVQQLTEVLENKAS